MKFLTGYLWRAPLSEGQQQELCQETALLLEQISYGKHNVVMAVVCNGGLTGSYVTGGLKIWLAQNGCRLFGKKWNSSMVRKELERVVARLLEESKRTVENEEMDVELTGILMAEQDFWIMQNGGGSIFLLNRKFHRTRCRRVCDWGERSAVVVEGSMESCVGVLLGNSDFLRHSIEKTMAQCLAAQDVYREEQINNRLKELSEESRRQGYLGECSAIYIKSV